MWCNKVSDAIQERCCLKRMKYCRCDSSYIRDGRELFTSPSIKRFLSLPIVEIIRDGRREGEGEGSERVTVSMVKSISSTIYALSSGGSTPPCSMYTLSTERSLVSVSDSKDRSQVAVPNIQNKPQSQSRGLKEPKP